MVLSAEVRQGATRQLWNVDGRRAHELTPSLFIEPLRNPSREFLLDEAQRRGESEGQFIMIPGNNGQLERGAFAVKTEEKSRIAKDKYVVDGGIMKGQVLEPTNRVMQTESFLGIQSEMFTHLYGNEEGKQRPIEVDLYLGADPQERRHVRVVTNSAWAAAFALNLYREPTEEEKKILQDKKPDITIMHAPDFKADPKKYGLRREKGVALGFGARDFDGNAPVYVLAFGTDYAGEIKKSGLTAEIRLNRERGNMTMHCSATELEDGRTAIFFGLSGTGKTTLSSTRGMMMIGDDEIVWTERGIYNLEGGSYAKTINLSPGDEKENSEGEESGEPLIYNASIQYGSILENVTIDPDTKFPNFFDESEENARAAYPLDFIPTRKESGMGDHPSAIFMLTADAYGVMPPIAELTPEQAMYHWLLGYTAKVGKTEDGVVGIEPTFSTGFAEPFFPDDPIQYAQLLGKYINTHNPKIYLVNTGWIGGSADEGKKRMPLKDTRRLIRMALDGSLDDAPSVVHPVFGVRVPQVEGIVTADDAWEGREDLYQQKMEYLANSFQREFDKSYAHRQDRIIHLIRGAGPQLVRAA